MEIKNVQLGSRTNKNKIYAKCSILQSYFDEKHRIAFTLKSEINLSKLFNFLKYPLLGTFFAQQANVLEHTQDYVVDMLCVENKTKRIRLGTWGLIVLQVEKYSCTVGMNSSNIEMPILHCYNHSVGVALNARFTTNGMWAKNNNIYLRGANKQ